MNDKNEQPVQQEKSLVIDITSTRGLLALLALAVVTAAFLGILVWGPERVAADAPSATGDMRKYYLTPGGNRRGNQTLGACASGYHMASLWEILDPSNLEYNTDLGRANTDSGEGPPTYEWGWIRTGNVSSTTNGAGYDNCAAWTSEDAADYGTLVYLSRDWLAGLEEMHVWALRHDPCSFQRGVWCVED